MSVTREGAPVVVELADDLSSATIDGRAVGVKVVADLGARVELEIAGEPVVVTGWPAPCATPPASVGVNGESWTVDLAIEGGASPSVALPPPATPPVASPTSGPTGPGVAIVPPMPGRVVDVRVREGERVERGAVLLVLEAMKMRNEVVAPTAGVVRQLRVADGSNVRAREPMLLIAPA